MSSIGVVILRNSPLARAQVLQESVNNSGNISNNKREIVIVRKKKLQSAPTVSVTSLVRAVDASEVPAKRLRLRDDDVTDEAKPPTPLAVARRNARERNRVRQVNDGFAALRKHIPEEVAVAFETANSNRGANKKLSKVETLRMAVEYIRNLESLLNIGHDKENPIRPSMESFPSPASSSPRDNSQERSYYSINSPMLDDEDIDEDELDGSLSHMQQQYINLPVPESFQLVSTPHLYEEEDGQPMTPSSDLLAQEDVNAQLLGGNFQFPNSAEQFTVIPEQSYCDSDLPVGDADFEIKYADSLSAQMSDGYAGLPLDALNPDLMLSQESFKYKENEFVENQFSAIELKKELPDIQVTAEDREQFEETLKWWQEKTRLARPIN